MQLSVNNSFWHPLTRSVNFIENIKVDYATHDSEVVKVFIQQLATVQ